MEVKTTESGNNNGTSLRESDDPDSSEAEKRRLRNQINQLKALISQMGENLDVTRFGNVDKSTVSPIALDRQWAKRVIDTDALFRKELHRYVGFYCAKMSKTEYVFHYKPYDKFGSGKTWSVQIRVVDGKPTLGHWVMPLGVDIDKILSQTPISELPKIIAFLRNWKLHIDCYSERKSQFQELKEFTSESTNFTACANLNFTLITLQLFRVYHKTKDTHVDLIVYLVYKQNETRACKISSDWNLKKCPAKDETELKSYTKLLKTHSLLEGFELMMKTNHAVFSWTTEDNNSSPLELNDTSDSDEESITEQVNLGRKKVTRKRGKRRESKERSKRPKPTAKPKKIQPRVSADKSTSQSSYATRSSSPSSPIASKPMRLRTKNLHPEIAITTNELAVKPGRKLRQTTINFRSNAGASTANTSNPPISELHKISKTTSKPAVVTKKKSPVAKKQSPLVGILSVKKKGRKKNVNRATTSTPLNKKFAKKVEFMPNNDLEISPIASGDEKDEK